MASNENELITIGGNTAALISEAEINQQIATARKFPRSVTGFLNSARAMIEKSPDDAGEMIYAVPRDGKTIEGASARFAEVIAYAWGNCRVAARVVDEGREFVTAQGVFHDLERNVAYSVEVQRRITTSKGVRYKPDMIGVTGNAANSIAARNATLKGIPKAMWNDLYQTARLMVTGDHADLVTRRAKALAAFAQAGIPAEIVFKIIGKTGERDIMPDDLIVLRGLLTAIREGDTTPEQIMAEHVEAKPQARPKADIGAALNGKPKEGPQKAGTEAAGATIEAEATQSQPEGETASGEATAQPETHDPETGEIEAQSMLPEFIAEVEAAEDASDLADVLKTWSGMVALDAHNIALPAIDSRADKLGLIRTEEGFVPKTKGGRKGSAASLL